MSYRGRFIGDWLGQCVDEWVSGRGRLVNLEYSNRLAAYAGETLSVGGSVESIDAAAGKATIELWVRNEAGAVVTPGRAMVAMDGRIP